MSGRTNRFRFTTLDRKADKFSDDDYKFSRADRIALDGLLTYVVERHVHSGQPLGVAPPAPPQLELISNGGTLRAGITVYYRYAFVNERGQDEMASQIVAVSTPVPLASPVPPTLSDRPGVLPGGDYFYAVSFWRNTTNEETTVSPEVSGGRVGFGGWTVNLPTAPIGVGGWNIYRRGPADRNLQFVAAQEAGNGSVFADDGDYPASRRVPAKTNSTFSTNRVIVTPPTVPEDYTWRLYRTTDSLRWDNSLVAWVAVASFTDKGHTTQPGVPPELATGVATAPKLDLITEAGGVLPPGLVVAPAIATFAFDGPTDEESVGGRAWVNEFTRATPTLLRIALPRGAPVVEDLQVQLILQQPSGEFWHRLVTATAAPLFATISAGDTVGAVSLVGARQHVADAFDNVQPVDLEQTIPLSMPPGIALRPLVTASAPTDLQLTVTITLLVSDGSVAETYVWETT